MATLNVSLTSELNTLIRVKVESGMYYSASEVVRAGLRLLQQQDEDRQLHLAKLQTLISTGIHHLESGDSIAFSSGNELMTHIRTKGTPLLASRKLERE